MVLQRILGFYLICAQTQHASSLLVLVIKTDENCLSLIEAN